MKILQIANFERKSDLKFYYNCDFKIFNGLVREGHAVYQFSDRDVAKELSPFKSRFGGRKKANEKLLRTFKMLMPDLIIAGHVAIIEDDTFKKLRKINPDVKIIFFNVDTLFTPEYQRNIDYLNKLACLADSIFITTAEPDMLKQFSGKKAKIGFMPNPFDKSIDSGRAFENTKPKYDVFFAGGWEYRHNLVKKVESEVSGLNVFKCGLRKDDRIFGSEYLKSLNNSRMGMNFSHGAEKKYTPYLYSSDRLSQYIGNGLLTFMSRETGYSDYFEEDEIAFFSDEEELLKKIRYFKKNDNEAKLTAKKGWKKGHEYYDSKLIARYMIESTFNKNLSHDYQWPTENY